MRSTANVTACSNSWAINTPSWRERRLHENAASAGAESSCGRSAAGSVFPELKLNISDDQIKQAILPRPAFQVDGKFDNNRYNAIVNQMGMTADQYAQALRNQLTTRS
jgi:hypothetical protein